MEKTFAVVAAFPFYHITLRPFIPTMTEAVERAKLYAAQFNCQTFVFELVESFLPEDSAGQSAIKTTQE